MAREAPLIHIQGAIAAPAIPSDARSAKSLKRLPIAFQGYRLSVFRRMDQAFVSSSRSARSICRWYSRSATLRTVSAMPKRGSTFC